MPKTHYNTFELGDTTACGMVIFHIDKGGYFDASVEYTDNPEEVTCKNCKRTKVYKKDEQSKK